LPFTIGNQANDQGYQQQSQDRNEVGQHGMLGENLIKAVKNTCFACGGYEHTLQAATLRLIA
jgi:hypothetical protein